jgi:hypothetical protein
VTTGQAWSEFADEHDVLDGCNVWIGQVAAIDLESMSESACSAWSAIGSMTEWLYSNVGEFASDALDVSKEAEADLDVRLAKCLREWMEAHAIKPNCFTIEYVESHVWEQCKEMRSGDAIDPRPAPDRCLLHIEHDGVCEWP